jgi:hypothetical protein
MPRHQLSILGVPEYSTQAIDHGQVPHRQGWNFPLCVTLFFLILRRRGLLLHGSLLGCLLLLWPSLVVRVRATTDIHLVLTHATVQTALQVLILAPI